MRLGRRRTRQGVEPALAMESHEPGAIPSELLERVRAIDIRARRIVNDMLLGEYKAVFRGRGLEFQELRPYVPGDDVRSLDWRTLARTGEPFIRRYTEDRDLTVIFVVDVSRSQLTGAGTRSKADLAAEICAVLALAAIRNRDRVGLLLFAGEPERYVRPQGGATHVLRVIREMLWARAASPGTNIGAALEYLIGVHRRRATVFLVSDFLTSGYSSQLRAAAGRHDIIAIRVREALDSELPAVGIVQVSDPETGTVREIDTDSPEVRKAYANWVASIDAERRHAFGGMGIDEIPIRVGEDFVPALLRFFKRRALSVA